MLTDQDLHHMVRNPMTAKEAIRRELERHTEHFLARGGVIQRVPIGVGQDSLQPIRRTRQQQIEHERKYFKAGA